MKEAKAARSVAQEAIEPSELTVEVTRLWPPGPIHPFRKAVGDTLTEILQD
jgi:hypothetical protein